MHADGCLFHLGRKDFQVKVRGYRIEAAEVETALLNLGCFTEAVVLTHEDRPGEKRLVAYLMTDGRPAPTVSALRRALAETLPEDIDPFRVRDAGEVPAHTQPGRWIARRCLRPGVPGPIWIALLSPLAVPLRRYWQRSGQRLDLDAVGIHDQFLELGGNSLLATQVLTQIREAFGIELQLRVLFETPTVAELSQALVDAEPEPGWVEWAAKVRQGIACMSAEEIHAALQQIQRGSEADAR